MTVNFKYRLLEGVRSADANNSLTFPANSVVTDAELFQSKEVRSDYLVWAAGSEATYDIGHPGLVFGWTKNEPGVSRFDWDGFYGRWNTMPGSGEETVGKMGQSEPIFVPIPVNLPSSYAPYALYVGSPEREVSFAWDLVPTVEDFTDPSPGSVQIAVENGQVRFSSQDLTDALLLDRPVYVSRQSFLDRQVATGRIGFFPAVSGAPTFMFLRPIPGSGQLPRIQIGNQPFLDPVLFPAESSMPAPSISGTVHVAGDTGRLLFADADVSSNLGREVYYRGVQCGTTAMQRIELASFPNSQYSPTPLTQHSDFVGLRDDARFVFFLELEDGQTRYYYSTLLSEVPPLVLPPGFVGINSTTGDCYVSSLDNSSTLVGKFYALDTWASIEDGIAIQFFRSGGSNPGFPEIPDFTRLYAVDGQVQTNNIQGSPLFLLPTLPQEDVQQSFAVRPSSGSSGTFSGVLNRAEDSNASGVGFKIDYAEKSILFVNRKTSNVTLLKSDYSFVAPNPAILSDGFIVRRNGVEQVSGRDFVVNMNGGTVEFVEPRGLSDSRSALGLRGLASGNNVQLISAPPAGDLTGWFFAIYSGPNSGIYSVQNAVGNTLRLDGPGFLSGVVTGDLVPFAETVVDRVWQSYVPTYRKISILAFSESSSVTLSPSDFSILPTTGQISLAKPAIPGQKIQISYSYFPEDENGTLLAPVTTQEFAAFSVFQETATIVSGKIRFNPEARNVVQPGRARIFVDGISLDDFRIEGNTIECGRTFSSENVTINYFVDSALGGETSFVLSHTNLDIDFPNVFTNPADNSGAHLTLNGAVNWTENTPVLIGDGWVSLVQSCTHDSSVGVSRVLFKSPPPEDLNNPTILFSTPLPDSRFLPVGMPQSAMMKGSRELILQGDARTSIRTDQFVRVQSDYFQVSTVSFDAAKNVSTVTMYAAAPKNYVLPAAFYVPSPVVRPTSSLYTSRALVAQVTPVVSKMTDTESTILLPGVDYTISEGGGIELAVPVRNGDTIRSMYLGRRLELAGTQFEINFAYQISPNSDNGIRGQSLLATFNLYNPDTFYFRAETVETYVPDLMEYIGQAAGSGTSSGPNIGNNYSSKMQSNGIASPFFEERRLDNMDSVAAQILLVYNSIVNGFEDFLSNLDGRVVGGTDGKFRFDGKKDNPDRLNYQSVTNDIDDRIFIDEPASINFSSDPAAVSFQGGKMYKDMWDTHARSRFYPTEKRDAAVVLNDQVNGIFDYNVTLGNFGVTSILSHETLVSTRSRLQFSLFAGFLRIRGANGDGASLVPPVKSGQVMEVYTDRGLRLETVSLFATPVRITIGAVVPISDGWLLSYVDTDSQTSVTLPIQTGSILRYRRDSDNEDENAVHAYTDEYVSVNHGDGSVHFKWQPPPFGPDGEVWGSEIVSSTLAFVNTDSVPRRPPVFDGGTLLDNGQVSEPLLSHENELRFISDEKESLGQVYAGSTTGTTIVSPTTAGQVGDRYVWVTGPNKGGVFTVLSLAGTNWNITPSQTVTGSERFIRTYRSGSDLYPRFPDAENGLLRVLSTNLEAPPYVSPLFFASPELVGAVGSEIQSLERILEAAGTVQVSSSGSVTGATLTDSVMEFGVDADVVVGDYVSILGFGIYKITNVDPHTLTVSTDAPFVAFRVTGPVSYKIIRRWDFLSESLLEQVARCFAFTYSFLTDTQDWMNGLSATSILSDRVNRLDARIIEIQTMVQSIQSILQSSETLYESRYVWVQQRIDRKEGLVSLGAQARARRKEQIQKIRSTQRKLKTLQKL